MSEQHCITLPNGCTQCDPVPAQPAIPARWETDAVEGWNGGARSIETLDGNVRVKFEVGQAAGIIIGLADPAAFAVERPETIQHGFYLWAQGDALLGQPIEYNALRGAPFQREPGDVLEIRRINDTAYYLHEDTVVYTSPAFYAGDTCVGACLYQTGDTVY